MPNKHTRLAQLESEQSAAANYEIVITWHADDTITRTRRPLPPGQDAAALRVIWSEPEENEQQEQN